MRGEVKNNRQFAQVKADIARLMHHLGELNHAHGMEAAGALTNETAERSKLMSSTKSARRSDQRDPARGRNAGQHGQRRQQKTGRVVSDKMQKTIVVAVESLKRHPHLQTYVQVHDKFKAHDEHNEARMGDMVRIEETRPLSKDKRWRLVEITSARCRLTPVAQVVRRLDPGSTGRRSRR